VDVRALLRGCKENLPSRNATILCIEATGGAVGDSIAGKTTDDVV